ncbi:unnamed protein product, partial [Ceratitis capitata]
MIICNTKKLTSDDNICAGAHDVAYNDNGIMVKQVATTTTIITYSAIMSISQTAECDKKSEMHIYLIKILFNDILADPTRPCVAVAKVFVILHCSKLFKRN